MRLHLHYKISSSAGPPRMVLPIMLFLSAVTVAFGPSAGLGAVDAGDAGTCWPSRGRIVTCTDKVVAVKPAFLTSSVVSEVMKVEAPQLWRTAKPRLASAFPHAHPHRLASYI
jgi:hypothetical protein